MSVGFVYMVVKSVVVQWFFLSDISTVNFMLGWADWICEMKLFNFSLPNVLTTLQSLTFGGQTTRQRKISFTVKSHNM